MKSEKNKVKLKSLEIIHLHFPEVWHHTVRVAEISRLVHNNNNKRFRICMNNILLNTGVRGPGYPSGREILH